MQPPWEARGLPHDLTTEHFAVAERAFITGAKTLHGQETLTALAGPWGTRAHIYGLDRELNAARLVKLVRSVKPAAREDGNLIYPAILVPDPTEPMEGSDVLPIGVVCATGYLGSTWSVFGTEWAHQIRRGIPRRRFYVTRLWADPAGTDARLFVPIGEKLAAERAIRESG